MVPFITLRPTARIAKEPPIATNPLAISFQLIPLIFFRALASTFNAAPTTNNPVLSEIIFLGNKRIAIVTSVNAPAIATRPLPSRSQLIVPKSFIALANIFIADASITIAVAVDITFLAFPVSFVNADTSSSSAPTLASPFPISSHDIPPNFFTADARTTIAEERINIPIDVPVILPSSFAKFKNRASSAIKPPIATRPFTIPSGSIEDNFLSALANIRTAVLMLIIAVQALNVPVKSPLILLNTAREPISSPNNAVIAPSEAVSFSGLIVAITKIEAANIPIAPAIFSKVPALRFC